LLRLIELLQSGRPYNSSQLAATINVSRRTVFRDLRLLEESGIPLLFNEERQGYAIHSSVMLPTGDFTLDETLSLLTLCHSLGDAERGIPFQRSAQSAGMKLLSNLPHRLREYVGEHTDDVSVRLEPSNRLTEAQPAYDQICRALSERRQARISYQSLDEGQVISTALSPYRVLFSRRSWYVIGRSSLHREVRTFNVSRILRVELLDTRYRVPTRFNLDRYLGNAWHLIREPRARKNVVVRFQKLVAQNVAEVRWHKTQKLVWRKDGSLDFHATVDGLREIVWWILGYGCQAEVIKPAELRDMVRRHVERLQQIYGVPPRPGKADLPKSRRQRPHYLQAGK